MENAVNALKAKACPHCGRRFGFVNFLLQCGSDTLISHAALVRRVKEHRCPSCRHLFLVRYQEKKLAQASAGVLPFFLAAAVLCTFLLRGLMALTGEQMAAAGMVFLLLGYLLHLSYLKYTTSELKAA